MPDRTSQVAAWGRLTGRSLPRAYERRDPLLARGWDLYLVAAAALVAIAVPTGPGQSAMVDAMNVVALLLFLPVLLARPDAFSLPFALPVLMISAGTLLATANAASVSASLTAVLQDAYLYLWFVLLVALMTRRGDLRGVRVAWLCTADAIALFGLAAYFAGGRSWHELLSPHGDRTAATFTNANMFADYLMLSVFVAVSLGGQVRRGILVPSLLLLLLALVSTKSNGGLMSLAAGLLVWAAARASRSLALRPPVAVALPLVLAAVLVGSWTWSEWRAGGPLLRGVEEQSYLGRMSHSSEERHEIQRQLIGIYARFPLGLGPGNSALQPLTVGERTKHDSFQSKEAHSDYIGYLVERGPLALAGLLLGTAQAFALVLAAWRRTGRAAAAPGSAALAAALLGALVGTSVHSMVIEKLHFRHVWLLLAMVCAVTSDLPGHARAMVSPALGPGPKGITRLGAAASLGGGTR